MASLEGVLANIPGYGGYLAKRQMNEQSDDRDLQNTSRLMQIAQAVQAQKEQQQTRSLLSQGGGDLEAAVQAALKAGRPDIAAKLAPLIEAQRKSQPQPQSIGAGGLRLPGGEIIPPAARPVPPEAAKAPQVRQRYDGTNVIQEEFVGGQWRKIGSGPRFQPTAPEKPPKLPNPKAGYRYKPDGSGEQEPIPGGPVAVQLNATKADASKNVNLAVQSIDALELALSDLEKDPGLSRITGSVFGRTPNLTNEATGAQTKLESIKSQTFVAALQAMRQASKTGGAVGNVTEKEGDKLENSLAALGQAQGTADFKNQLIIMRQRLKASKDAMRRAYKEQFGEDAPSTQVREPEVPTDGSTVFSDQDKERRYQEWKARQK